MAVFCEHCDELGRSSLGQELLALQEGLCSMEYVNNNNSVSYLFSCWQNSTMANY